MLRIIRVSPRFIPAFHGGRGFSWPARSPLTILRMLREALQEGLAAHRHYEELRSKGIAHDSALREALALAPAPARSGCEALTPLWFAGKA
jgi:hypothetical protein